MGQTASKVLKFVIFWTIFSTIKPGVSQKLPELTHLGLKEVRI